MLHRFNHSFVDLHFNKLQSDLGEVEASSTSCLRKRLLLEEDQEQIIERARQSSIGKPVPELWIDEKNELENVE